MKDSYRRFLNRRLLPALAFFGLLVGLAGSPPALAVGPALFQDDFSGGLTAWSASPLGLFGGWDGSGGVAAYDGGGHTQIVAGEATWTDYSVEVRLRLASTANHPGGLRGRVNATTGQAYAAWLYPADGVVRLFRTAGWNIDTTGLALLDEAAVGTISSGVFHTLALSFEGAEITVALDGVPVLAATDGTLTAGGIALDVSNQPIDFDDVVVSPRVLFSDDFSPSYLLGWTPSPLGRFAGWDGSGGVAAYDGGGHTQLVTGEAFWDDYTVSTRFRLASTANHPGGLRGRARGCRQPGRYSGLGEVRSSPGGVESGPGKVLTRNRTPCGRRP